jgi:XTP/dITP diphosphohydrolase
MDIIVASNNNHKIEEYRKIFSKFNINVLSLKDANIVCDVEEVGETFQENSLIKARECAKYTNKPLLSDDSGLIVDSLPDYLGVRTAREFGENTPYPVKWRKVIDLLKNKNRNASFVCCITILNLEEKPLVFLGRCYGKIAEAPSGNNGFGYDPIFIPDGYDKTFSDIDEEEKNKISHRGLACEKMIEYLKGKF